MTRILGTILVAAMFILAGYSGAPFPGTNEQTSEPMTALYLSDAPIDDFEHLNVKPTT